MKLRPESALRAYSMLNKVCCLAPHHMWSARTMKQARSFFFLQAEDGIRYLTVTGVQTCALPISHDARRLPARGDAAALGGKLDAAVARHAQVVVARHAFEGRRDRRWRDAQFFRQVRADRRLLLLDHLPDRLEVIFLRDAGFFSPQTASFKTAC